jgi:hypothetical protein
MTADQISKLLWFIFENMSASVAVLAAAWMAAHQIPGWGWFLCVAAWLGLSIRVIGPPTSPESQSSGKG